MPRVIHTRALFWAQGMAVAPWLVLIRPSRRGDEALLAHELVHVEQMRRHGTLKFWKRWVTSRVWRAHYEIEAYRAALVHRPHNLDLYAASLASNYGLRVSVSQARKLLTQAVG